MIHTTEDRPRGIRWTLFSTLKDMDFVDDLALLSHTLSHIQEKTSLLSKYAHQVGLRAAMTINTSAHQGEWKRPPNDQTV